MIPKIDEEDIVARHRAAVDEVKKDRGGKTREEITSRARVALAELNEQAAQGLTHFFGEKAISVDQALAYMLAGKVVTARKVEEK